MDIPGPADVARSPEQLFWELSQRRLFEQALRAPRPRQLSILWMHHVEERPMPEIAQALAIPLKTAYSRLASARRRLAAAVRRLLHAPPKPSRNFARL